MSETPPMGRSTPTTVPWGMPLPTTAIPSDVEPPGIEAPARLLRTSSREVEQGLLAAVAVGVALCLAAPVVWWAGVRSAPDPAAAALVQRGRSSLAAGDTVGAIRLFEQARRAAPDDPAPLTGLGDAHGARGELEAARMAYGRALALAPDPSAADVIRRHLGALGR